MIYTIKYYMVCYITYVYISVFHRLLPPMVITAVINGNNLSGKNRFLPW